MVDQSQPKDSATVNEAVSSSDPASPSISPSKRPSRTWQTGRLVPTILRPFSNRHSHGSFGNQSSEEEDEASRHRSSHGPLATVKSGAASRWRAPGTLARLSCSTFGTSWNKAVAGDGNTTPRGSGTTAQPAHQPSLGRWSSSRMNLRPESDEPAYVGTIPSPNAVQAPNLASARSVGLPRPRMPPEDKTILVTVSCGLLTPVPLLPPPPPARRHAHGRHSHIPTPRACPSVFPETFYPLAFH